MSNEPHNPTHAQHSDTRLPTPIDQLVTGATADLPAIVHTRTFWFLYGFLQAVAFFSGWLYL